MCLKIKLFIANIKFQFSKKFIGNTRLYFLIKDFSSFPRVVYTYL